MPSNDTLDRARHDGRFENVARWRRVRRIMPILWIALALALALVSRYYVESAAPLARGWASAADDEPQSGSSGGGWDERGGAAGRSASADDEPSAAVTGLHWFSGGERVAIGTAQKPPVTATRDGGINGGEPTRLVKAAPADGSGLTLAPAVAALSRRTGADGIFYTRIPRADVMTPGGLSAIMEDGAFVVTGAAGMRQAEGGGRRSVATKPDPRSLWIVLPWTASPEIAFELGRDIRLPSDVTALAILPGLIAKPARPSRIVSGTATGSLHVFERSSPSERKGASSERIGGPGVSPVGVPNPYTYPSGDAPPLPAVASAHAGPVVALAATPVSGIVAEGVLFASASDDRGIKVWRESQPGTLESADVAFSGGRTDFILTPESLELSGFGETLLVKSPTGTLYVARLVDDRLLGGLWARVAEPTASGTDAALESVQPQAQMQVPTPVETPRYSVRIVIKGDDATDPDKRRNTLSDLSREIAKLPLSYAPGFPPDVFDRAFKAVDERRSLVIEAPQTVDAANAAALDTINNPFLSIMAAPIRLRAVPLGVPATAATLALDGKRLFAAGADCLIREIDLSALLTPLAADDAKAPVVSVLRGHGGPAIHLALTEGDTHLAAASLDGRVRIHRLDHARQLGALPLAQLPTGPDCAPTQPITLAPGPIPNGNFDFKVFVQFAGAVDRGEIIKLAQSLAGDGWNVQGGERGGERTPKAAGYYEVRFGPDTDQAAAERLAGQANLAFNGPTRRIMAAQQNRSIKAGNLELWISR